MFLLQTFPPLSLLNAVSKICERAALNQFKAYLMRNKLLSSQQSSNKKQHSTETLNLLITDLLLDAMDNKKISALVLIDLSKAFDSISHSRRGSRPWRKWLEPRSDFFHLGIFCINLFEDIRLNILRFTLYSYNNKNLGNFMSYFF